VIIRGVSSRSGSATVGHILTMYQSPSRISTTVRANQIAGLGSHRSAARTSGNSWGASSMGGTIRFVTDIRIFRSLAARCLPICRTPTRSLIIPAGRLSMRQLFPTYSQSSECRLHLRQRLHRSLHAGGSTRRKGVNGERAVAPASSERLY